VPAFAVVLSQALWRAEQPAVVPALAWASGFVLYQWISPAEIGWWRDGLDFLSGAAGLPFPLSDSVTWLGAAVPAFLLAFTADSLIAPVSRVLPAQRRTSQATG